MIKRTYRLASMMMMMSFDDLASRQVYCQQEKGIVIMEGNCLLILYTSMLTYESPQRTQPIINYQTAMLIQIYEAPQRTQLFINYQTSMLTYEARQRTSLFTT